jgi:hypothetical protein
MDPMMMMNARSPLDESFETGSGSFWAGLFDLSFTQFITPKLIRTLYLLGMLIALIIAVGAVLVAFFESGIWAGIWSLMFAPVWLVVVFRIAQATMRTAENTAAAK